MKEAEMINDNVWYFEGINLYKVLCPHRYKEFKKNHKSRHYDKKEYIYFEQDASNKVFLIEKGKVKIGYITEDGEEYVNSILVKGDIFGEKSILGEQKRSEFAQSVDGTEVCLISTKQMHGLLRDNKDLNLYIFKVIGLQIKKLERRLQRMLFKDAKTRLIEFIFDLKDEFGILDESTGNTIIQHPYNQKDMASLIGVKRPTINILLNQLKNEGIIDFSRKEIILKNTQV